MSTDLEQQLARFAEALDREAPTITFDAIVGREMVSIDVDLLGPSIELMPTVVSRRPVRRVVALKVESLGSAAAAALVVALAVVIRDSDAPEPADEPPATVDSAPPSTEEPVPPTTTPTSTSTSAQESPFVNVWQSTDVDGSLQTMYIARWGAQDYEVVVIDDSAAGCPGRTQIAGTGRPAGDTSLTIAQPISWCLGGTDSPPTVEPAPFTVDLSTAMDELVDSFGVVWRPQVMPQPDAEDLGVLEAFLEARLAGEGAEPYLLGGPAWVEHKPVPLLYATTGGSRYERFEIERLSDPGGLPDWTKVEVRLFAEDGTVVEQRFHVVLEGGQRSLVYGQKGYDLPTTENGQSVPVPFRLLDGEVTFAAAPPWIEDCCIGEPALVFQRSWRNLGWFVIAAAPLSVGQACDTGPAPTDAEALARSILADLGREATEAVPVRIAGLDALRIDVMSSGYSYLCAWDVGMSIQAGGRIRLFIADYPGESAEVLTFAVLADPLLWEDTIASITPILDSIQFHLD